MSQPNPEDLLAQAPAEPAETAPAADDSADAPEVVPSLESLLRQAELKAQENHDAWLRAKAEVENVRKRGQQEVANAHKYALESFGEALLPVKDALEMALKVENATVETIRSGVDLTLKQLSAVFEKYNLVEIDPLGQKFDPHRHQAIAMVPSADAEPNTVINVMQKGYLLNDRVVRPALVAVAQKT